MKNRIVRIPFVCVKNRFSTLYLLFRFDLYQNYTFSRSCIVILLLLFCYFFSIVFYVLFVYINICQFGCRCQWHTYWEKRHSSAAIKIAIQHEQQLNSKQKSKPKKDAHARQPEQPETNETKTPDYVNKPFIPCTILCDIFVFHFDFDPIVV